MRLDGGVSHTRAPWGSPIWRTYRPTATSAVIAPFDEGPSDLIAQIIGRSALSCYLSCPNMFAQLHSKLAGVLPRQAAAEQTGNAGRAGVVKTHTYVLPSAGLGPFTSRASAADDSHHGVLAK